MSRRVRHVHWHRSVPIVVPLSRCCLWPSRTISHCISSNANPNIWPCEYGHPSQSTRIPLRFNYYEAWPLPAPTKRWCLAHTHHPRTPSVSKLLYLPTIYASYYLSYYSALSGLCRQFFPPHSRLHAYYLGLLSQWRVAFHQVALLLSLCHNSRFPFLCCKRTSATSSYIVLSWLDLLNFSWTSLLISVAPPYRRSLLKVPSYTPLIFLFHPSLFYRLLVWLLAYKLLRTFRCRRARNRSNGLQVVGFSSVQHCAFPFAITAHP